MIVIPATQTISGTSYVKQHEFSNGHSVPIFHVSTYYALNQIIGYVKYINRDCGTVYYRGQCKLYPSLIPSLVHSIKAVSSRQKKMGELNSLITKIANDPALQKEIGITSEQQKDIIEGLLQHYGVPTRCIDVVDNHWVALWFGANQWVSLSKQDKKPYCTYRQRDTAKDTEKQYLILICADNHHSKQSYRGILKGKSTITVDLRSALPSTFVRPHAQHGLVIKKVAASGEEDYNLASCVAGILELRTSDVVSWIGNGTLLSQQNLFPAPPYDHGYEVLLSRQTDLNAPFSWYVV